MAAHQKMAIFFTLLSLISLVSSHPIGNIIDSMEEYCQYWYELYKYHCDRIEDVPIDNYKTKIVHSCTDYVQRCGDIMGIKIPYDRGHIYDNYLEWDFAGIDENARNQYRTCIDGCADADWACRQTCQCTHRAPSMRQFCVQRQNGYAHRQWEANNCQRWFEMCGDRTYGNPSRFLWPQNTGWWKGQLKNILNGLDTLHPRYLSRWNRANEYQDCDFCKDGKKSLP